VRTTWILLVIAFVSGALSGFFVGRSQAVHHQGDLPSRDEILDRFVDECGLDHEQRATFQRIFDENHPRFVTVKMSIEPALAALRSEVRVTLRETLREDQKRRFDAYCAERDRQRDANMR
jgi:hypothetical protein